MKVSIEEHQKLSSEHSRMPPHEDLKSKYKNHSSVAPRLTHPPFTFPTYQGTYCLSSYSGGMEPRSVNGVYPVPVNANKIEDYNGRNTLLNNNELEWRA